MSVRRPPPLSRSPSASMPSDASCLMFLVSTCLKARILSSRTVLSHKQCHFRLSTSTLSRALDLPSSSIPSIIVLLSSITPPTPLYCSLHHTQHPPTHPTLQNNTHNLDPILPNPTMNPALAFVPPPSMDLASTVRCFCPTSHTLPPPHPPPPPSSSTSESSALPRQRVSSRKATSTAASAPSTRSTSVSASTILAQPPTPTTTHMPTTTQPGPAFSPHIAVRSVLCEKGSGVGNGGKTSEMAREHTLDAHMQQDILIALMAIIELQTQAQLARPDVDQVHQPMAPSISCQHRAVSFTREIELTVVCGCLART